MTPDLALERGALFRCMVAWEEGHATDRTRTETHKGADVKTPERNSRAQHQQKTDLLITLQRSACVYVCLLYCREAEEHKAWSL